VLGTLPAVEAGPTGAPKVFVVIRLEDVCADEDGPFSGRVERVTSLGGGFETEIAGPDWRVWAMMPEPPKPGTSLRFAVRKTAIVGA
jgi:hypothetical protein